MSTTRRNLCIALAALMAVWSPALCCCVWKSPISTAKAAGQSCCSAGKQAEQGVTITAALEAPAGGHACQCRSMGSAADEPVAVTTVAFDHAAFVFALLSPQLAAVDSSISDHQPVMATAPPGLSSPTLLALHCQLTI